MSTKYFFVVRPDARGKWRWSFYGPSGNHLAVSGEGYEDERDCREAIDLLCLRAHSAAIRVVSTDRVTPT